MRAKSKRMGMVFFLLSGVVFLTGCSKSVHKKEKKLETVIVAESTEDANRTEESFFDGKTAAKKSDINLNQVGYRRKDQKIAVIRNDSGSKNYQILDEEGNIAFAGRLLDRYTDKQYNETLYYADFSAFQEEGTYYIKCGDEVTSPLFEIDDSVYNELGEVAIKPFANEAYFKSDVIENQKEQEKKNQQERELLVKRGQTAKIIETEQQIDVSGGWSATSNDGWFTVPSITALANMIYLNTYNASSIENMPGQSYGSKIKLDQSIKEELEWLLKMQNSNSGGVYHKAATADGSMSGGSEQIYVSAISSCATADFTAIMAKAAKIYQNSDKELSKQCMSAAKKAWKYLKEHPENSGYSNEEGITSREYTDHVDSDERFWAATELYLATREEEYLQAMKSFDIEQAKVDFGWSLVTGYAYYDFYTMSENKETELYKKIKETLKKEVEKTKKVTERGYLINREYAQVSLEEILNRGVLLSLMNQADKKKEDKLADWTHNYLNYIMGGNPESQNAFHGMRSKNNGQTLEISSALLIVLQGINA